MIKKQRLEKLNEIAKSQSEILINNNEIKEVKGLENQKIVLNSHIIA